MSKTTIVVAVSATLALAACARQAPEPEHTPMPEPVIMEPTSTKAEVSSFSGQTGAFGPDTPVFALSFERGQTC